VDNSNLKFKIENLKFEKSPATRFINFGASSLLGINFLFFIFVGGCAVQKRVCPPVKSAIEAKNLLNENAVKIKPFRATGDCTISYVNGKDEKFGQSFPVRMWYIDNQKFCFYGDVGFDPKGLSFAVSDGLYWVYVKPMRVFVKGAVNTAGKDYFSNPTLLVDFLRPVESDCKISVSKNVMMCKDRQSGKQKNVFIDSCGGVAEKIEYFERDAKPFLVVEAEKYEKVKDANFIFPNKLFYEYHDNKNGRNQMEIKFDSVKLWEPSPQQVKALFTPPEMTENKKETK